jgi:drug/metabolite transporter (DMT)-like permease
VNPTSLPILGIALAVLSAAALSVGNLFQARSVRAVAHKDPAVKQSVVRRLLTSRNWLLGGLLLIVAIVLQMLSLAFAPLIVVQPVGVTALVFTTLITSIVLRKRPTREVVRSITICVVGVGAFVSVAAAVSTQHAVTSVQLAAVLSVLVAVLVLAGVVLLLSRGNPRAPILWVLLGGVFSAFVATLGKTVILRVQTALASHSFAFDAANLLTIGCIVGIGVAGALSIYFVQRAHADNRPDVVVAGLTVVDPTVAVVLGIAILGEASDAPAWTFIAFAVAGAVAITGVFALSRAEQSSAEQPREASTPA